MSELEVVVRIGTRGSALALTQTRMLASRLEELLRSQSCTPMIKIIDIKTLGDKKQGTAQAAFGDKKDWIYELELAILAGEIDLAVHSGKDVPSDIEANTSLFPVLERELANDVFIGKQLADGSRTKFADLKSGELVGTASLRRQAALRIVRPMVRCVDHRGNITTRVDKLDDNPDLAGIILAAAGLRRLGLFEKLNAELLSTEEMLPAVGQGTLVVQTRSSDTALSSLVEQLIHLPTMLAWKAERVVIERLEGDCRSSISVHCRQESGELTLRARVMLPDGSRFVESVAQLPANLENSLALGEKVSAELIEKGAKEILSASRA